MVYSICHVGHNCCLILKPQGIIYKIKNMDKKKIFFWILLKKVIQVWKEMSASILLYDRINIFLWAIPLSAFLSNGLCVYRMPNRTWGLNPMHNFVSPQRCLLSSCCISFISLSLSFPLSPPGLAFESVTQHQIWKTKRKSPVLFRNTLLPVQNIPSYFFFPSTTPLCPFFQVYINWTA